MRRISETSPRRQQQPQPLITEGDKSLGDEATTLFIEKNPEGDKVGSIQQPTANMRDKRETRVQQPRTKIAKTHETGRQAAVRHSQNYIRRQECETRRQSRHTNTKQNYRQD